VEDANEDELYAAMDWLLERQGLIEQRLAERYLAPGEVVLYDLMSMANVPAGGRGGIRRWPSVSPLVAIDVPTSGRDLRLALPSPG
jgi:hypothetical protein